MVLYLECGGGDEGESAALPGVYPVMCRSIKHRSPETVQSLGGRRGANAEREREREKGRERRRRRRKREVEAKKF